MPHLRGQDERQREDEGRQTEVALPRMRGVERAQARQRRENPRGVPQVAAVQRRHSRPRDEQDDLLAKDGVDMEDLADSPGDGRASRRGVVSATVKSTISANAD